jgi:hypothetical protein
VLVVAYFADVAMGNPFRKLFDLGAEANLPSWFSSIQLLTVGAGLGLFAHVFARKDAPRTWSLWILPCTFLLLSIDEAISVHEFVGRSSDALLPGGSRDHGVFAATGIWMFLLGPPLMAVMAGGAWRCRVFYLSVRGCAEKGVLGLALFLSGALGVEILRNFAISGTLGFHLQVVAEEGLEMAGITMVLWAVIDLLRGSGVTVCVPGRSD